VLSAGGCAVLNYPFLTLKERDIETGLDYFGARYYASTQGRFTSSDPLLSSGSVYAPQTWNRYSYTINNPLKYTDQFGMYICNGTKDQCKDVENGLKKLEKARDSFKKG
jgi:RHS repeat-associated protein